MNNKPQFYGRRLGRPLSTFKANLLETLLPQLRYQSQDVGPFWLEIGFGGGEHLAAQARLNPTQKFIGAEPFINGVASLLRYISEQKLDNVLIFDSSVHHMIEQLPKQSLQKVFILFADPWPKARHNKRRLIQTSFLKTLENALCPGAEIVIATDHDDYKQWIMEAFLSLPNFRLQYESTEMPENWIETRYEKRGRRLGHTIWYLSWVFDTYPFDKA